MVLADCSGARTWNAITKIRWRALKPSDHVFIIALARGFLRAVLDKRCSYGFMRLYDRIFAAKMLILCQRERDFQLRMQH